MAFQCGAVSNKFSQWCFSAPCKYLLGRPVVSQCTLDQPVAFQCSLDQPVYTGSGLERELPFQTALCNIKCTERRWLMPSIRCELSIKPNDIYRIISNIRRTKSQNLNDSRLVLHCFAQSIVARCWVENEDVANYIWVINNCITYSGATYIRDLTVRLFITKLNQCMSMICCYLPCLIK